MTEKLTDPSKPAHEIIEVLEDGDAMRNDGVRLQAANKNPWYVLATIYGEQPEGGYDDELAAKNRRAWNGWFCASLSKEECEGWAKILGQNVKELFPLNEAELKEIKTLFRQRLEDETAELPSRDENISFNRIYFPNYCSFSSYIFNTNVFFSDAIFCKDASFRNAQFEMGVIFTGTEFKDAAVFWGANFRSSASFLDVTFNTVANFQSVIFGFGANFDNTIYKWFAIFKEASFLGTASFRGAIFDSPSHFHSAKFESTTNFKETQFLTHVPEFYAAELYDDTVFPTPDNYTDNWPPLKGQNVMPAADQKRAYSRLRLFMNRSLQIEEEQFFHRQEMRCKTRLARWYHKPFYWLYALLSDYGNSVWRPMVGIIAVTLFGALFMLWWQEAFTFLPKESTGFDWTLGLLGEDDPWAKPRQAAGWSISNTLPFLGFGKLYYGELAKELAWPLKVAGGVQTLLGYVLLFFLGLGLRNRFRLR